MEQNDANRIKKFVEEHLKQEFSLNKISTCANEKV